MCGVGGLLGLGVDGVFSPMYATAMEQILLPLQWTSSAKPLAAKVRSHDNGIYVVDAFVGVMAKTLHPPCGLTIDQANFIIDTAIRDLCDDRDGPPPYEPTP